MAIDAHVQFWKYNKEKDSWISKDRNTLQEDYLPEHLAVTAKRNDITGVVAIQARLAEVDTRFLVELAKTHPVIKGVVGWIDLKSGDAGDKLNYFSQYPVIKGWCHRPGNETADLLSDPNFQKVITTLQTLNYTCDILMDQYRWPAVGAFISQFPEQRIVIDHCGQPDIRHKSIDEWKFWIGEFAKYPNVYCKVSGLFTAAPWKQWSAGDFYPYLDVIFAAFGVDRLLFGSDWPTILLSGLYVQWKSLVEKYMENYSPEEKEQVFGANAIRFYGL